MSKRVAIIGAGMGGLSAAIYSRLAGWEVDVFEQASKVGGKAAGIEEAGYRLDPGPSIIILPRIYEQVFQAAGRQMVDYLTFTRLDPFSRVYYEGEEPLDLPADRAECLDVLERRFPEDANSFRSLMGKLDRVAPHIDRSIFKKPYDKSWSLVDRHLIATALQFDMRASYRQLVDGWFKSPLLRAFFYGFPSYGGQTYDSKAPGALLIPYLMLQEGVYYPKGGVAAIPAALEPLARELGVRIHLSKRVTGLKVEHQRVLGIEIEGRLDAFDSVISNLDRFTTAKWLGRVHTEAPSFSYFTLHWGIKRPIEGLEHHTLFVPTQFERGFERLYRDRRFPDPPIVYLNSTHLVDPTVAPSGHSNLFAVVTSPGMEPGIDWPTEVARCRSLILEQLKVHGVYWSEDDIVFERIQSPLYFAQTHGNYLGSLYGIDERHRLFGLLPHRNYDEEFENLYYCGGSVQPGAGLPMVTLSGKFAAERLPRL